MNLLYTEEELNQLSRRIKRRSIITLIVSLPFFAFFITFFVMHLRVSPSNPGPIAYRHTTKYISFMNIDYFHEKIFFFFFNF